jgi:hypothetical protein
MAYRVLDLGVAEEELNGAQIARMAVDQDRLRPAQRMGPVLERIEADTRNPIID